MTAHTRNRSDVFRPHLHFGQSIQESEVPADPKAPILIVSNSHARSYGLCSLTGTSPASLFAEPPFTFVLCLLTNLHDEHSTVAQTAFPVDVISPDLIKSLAMRFSLCLWIIYMVKM